MKYASASIQLRRKWVFPRPANLFPAPRSTRTFGAGDMFSFYFEDGIDTPVSLTLSFNTKSPADIDSPAPIPVPAGGVLLLSVLAGGAAFARHKTARG